MIPLHGPYPVHLVRLEPEILFEATQALRSSEHCPVFHPEAGRSVVSGHRGSEGGHLATWEVKPTATVGAGISSSGSPTHRSPLGLHEMDGGIAGPGLGRSSVDHQFVLGGLLHGEVNWFGTLRILST